MLLQVEVEEEEEEEEMEEEDEEEEEMQDVERKGWSLCSQKQVPQTVKLHPGASKWLKTSHMVFIQSNKVILLSIFFKKKKVFQ